MKRLLLVIACLLPWLGGCALFNPAPDIPPAPKVVGVAAQNKALLDKVRDGHGLEPDVFVPLIKAKAAVESARAQPKVGSYAASELARARAELKTAEELWSAERDKDTHSPAQLRKVEAHAHSAKRLAQIAQYTAVREINLAQLTEASDQLRQRQQAGAKASTAQTPYAGASAQQLVGKRVVPGQLGRFSFRAGTARLTSQSRSVVAKLATLLKRHSSVGVAILGYTSNSAPSKNALANFMSANPQLKQRHLTHEQQVYAYNMALSNARARTVARALVQAGIGARRIGARGFGSSRPVGSNATAKGRAANERVDAIIIPGPDSQNSPLRNPG